MHGFEFRVVFLYWLPTMADDSNLPYYLTHCGEEKRYVYTFSQRYLFESEYNDLNSAL